MFELFDPKQDYSVERGGNLPHWYQPGVTYFVTFRTEDSVPESLLRSWHAGRADWLKRNGIDPKDTKWRDQLKNSVELERRFHQKFTHRFMSYLDRGHGACRLREPRISRIVADAIQYFDGDRYSLGDFVIMPNHVHLLTCLLGATDIEKQCESWKRYSAVRINKLTGAQGRFWQEESFDHLVRSPEQFEHLQRYIAENPANAGLRAGEFLHWTRSAAL